MRVWLPHAEGEELMGGAPPGTVVEVYDGAGPEPATVGEVEVYVPPPFGGGSATLDVLGSMPRLRLLQTLTAGVDRFVDHVPDGVTLCDGSGIHDPSTAEWVLMATLASLHDLPAFVRAADRQHWDYRPTDVLYGKTVLIIGAGSIGAAVEARLAAYHVDVVRVARRAREGVHGVEELASLVPTADVVVVLVPMTPATRGLVDADLLAAMKDGALLVNAARGPVVDTAALLAELASGRLRAALDVTDPEPLPAGHPLWSAPGLLLTPHVGGTTTIFRPRAYAFVRRQLDRLLAGEELANVVRDGY